jgi:hypothetical protein
VSGGLACDASYECQQDGLLTLQALLHKITAVGLALAASCALGSCLTCSSSSGLYCTMKLLELPCARIGAAAASSSSATTSSRAMAAEDRLLDSGATGSLLYHPAMHCEMQQVHYRHNIQSGTSGRSATT